MKSIKINMFNNNKQEQLIKRAQQLKVLQLFLMKISEQLSQILQQSSKNEALESVICDVIKIRLKRRDKT